MIKILWPHYPKLHQIQKNLCHKIKTFGYFRWANSTNLSVTLFSTESVSIWFIYVALTPPKAITFTTKPKLILLPII